MGKSRIQWCDATWNVTTGCSPVSIGCKNCYARRMSRRLAGRFGYPEAPSHFDVTLHPDRIDEPLRWKKPRRIFVCSMGDLFHTDVPFPFVERVLKTMRRTPHHTYLILTKRPKRMLDFFGWWIEPKGRSERHIWIGTSVESGRQKHLTRIRDLTNTASIGKRIISFEPLLSEIVVPPSLLKQIDLVIVGCESGPGRRFTSKTWIRSLRDQCLALGDERPAFFLKQMYVNGKVTSMPELDGQKWEEWPE